MSGSPARRGATAPLPRWLCWLLGGVAGLVVLLLAALIGFRDNIYRELVEPTLPFQVAEPPPRPDWSDASAWAARPQGRADGAVAVFYVHPTTAYDGPRLGWNADPADPRSRERLDTLALPNHAAPFAAAGPLWIPHYRQAVLFAMIASREDTRDALGLAYGDVAAAFDAFTAARPPGAPFILAGTGQGGLHVVRLLQEKLAGTPQAAALVAAYVIDQPVPLDQLAPGGPLAWLPLCDGPQAVRCLVTFTEVDRGDGLGARLWRDRGLGWSAAQGYGRLGERPFGCVNPLNGGAGPDAPASANSGAVTASGLERGLEPPLLPGESGASCEAGLLLVDPDRQPALRPRRTDFGARYITPRFNLFYQALAEDARTRSRAFAAASP